MALSNYPLFYHVTNNRAISSEIDAQHQPDQCQYFSLGHNFMDTSIDCSKVSKRGPLLNYPLFCHVTNSRGISSEVVAQQQRDQCQNFSLGHNFMDKTLKYFSRSENLPLKIIHIIDRVTTNWLFFQKAPLFIFIWLLKWSCLGHN